VLDIIKKEFTETYIIGEGGRNIKINSTCFFQDYIYAATDEGLYRADTNSPNLVDFNYWNKVFSIPGFTGRFNNLANFNGKIYVNRKGVLPASDVVYAGDGNSWNAHPNISAQVVKKIDVYDNQVVIVSDNNITVFGPDYSLIRNIVSTSPQGAAIDANEDIYLADKLRGLVRFKSDNSSMELVPDGPLNLNVSEIVAIDNKIMVVPGGATGGDYNNLFRNAEISRFVDGKWNNHIENDYKDFYRIAIDPRDSEHYFIGSWGWGLLEYKGSELQSHYTTQNSTIQTTIPGNYMRISGLAFDKENKLWVVNSGVQNSLSVLKSTGEWVGFPIGARIDAPTLGRLLITSQNHKWIVVPRGRGLFVFDENGTIDDSNDDRYRKLSVVDNNNTLITNDVRVIAEDKKGNIWVGTNMGILVYYSPGRVFDNAVFYAQPITIPRNDGTPFGDQLLVTETVNAIAVDAADRKWLGTEKAGLFLVSPDGMTEIHRFNTDNSPILSNNVLDIEINEKNGEVFIVTDKGIISYLSDATAPAGIFDNVYVYPNPVRPDYQGDIVISGLLAETTVKITDINGNIVFETLSLGGQAIWDGNNFKGQRVNTGVYLVFCSDKEGILSTVTKLLFIN
jgi:hypothetical protein